MSVRVVSEEKLRASVLPGSRGRAKEVLIVDGIRTIAVGQILGSARARMLRRRPQ